MGTFGPADPVFGPATMGAVEIDRNGLEVLEREECLTLLGRASLGRVGVTIGALPSVVPVNYRLVGDEVVIRTGAGTKLDAATRNAVVAFEVDEMDPIEHTGWSVMVTGVAREVVDAAEIAELSRRPLPHWAPGGKERIIAISTELATGRRITHRSPAAS